MASSGNRRQLRFAGRGQLGSKICEYRELNGACGNLKVLLQKNGQLYESPFCKHHCCRKVTGQTPCHRTRHPQMHFCQEHLRCTSEMEGHRCPNWVKGLDPGTFGFCAAVHNCKAEGCSNERLFDGAMGLGYCQDHKCTEAACGRPMVQGARRCAEHTCEARNCLARVPGGDPGSVGRFCERHRICDMAGCGRFTFTRENGQACVHCGHHYCQFENCNNPRDTSTRREHCTEHSCVEQGCRKGREGAQSNYCKSHECKTDGCRFRKWLGDWCTIHQCARRGCDGEAVADHYCEQHAACSVAGCDQFRQPDGDGRCEEHSHPRCQRHGCTARAVENREWCADHICRMRNCSGPGQAVGGLCDRHRCSAQYCPEPRARMRSREWDDQPIYDGDTLAPFCREHWCRWSCCMQQTAPMSQWCPAHPQCEHPDCSRPADTASEDRTRCREHGRPYREYPGYRRHAPVFPIIAERPLPPVLRPHRQREALPRRGWYGRDMDDDWRWPQGI